MNGNGLEAPPTEGRLIGRRIVSLREKRGWTQADLARRAGLDTGYLSKLEGGQYRRPSAQRLGTIATTLNVPIADLMGEPPPPHDERLAARVRAIVGESPEAAELIEAILTDLEHRPASDHADILRHIAGLLRMRDRSHG